MRFHSESLYHSIAMKNNPVGWFEIYVQDMGRAKTFYEAVFKCELQDLPLPPGQELEMLAFPMDTETTGSPGALCKMTGVSSGGGGTLVYFSCEDCATEEARVGQAGGQVVRPKMSIGEYGFISLVADPDGNMIGLHSHS